MQPERTYDTWGYYNPKTLTPLSASYIAQLRQQNVDISKKAQEAQKAREFDPRSLISEGLGVVGAVGGGVIGGPVGAGIGGALGSGAGQFLENQAMGKPQNVEQIAGEAALGGLFGFGPVRAAKTVLGVPGRALGMGTKGAVGAAAAGAPADLLELTSKGGMKGAVATAVQNTRGFALGIKKGVAPPGMNPLTQAQSNSYYNFLENTIGNKSGGAFKAALDTEVFKRAVGKDIGNTIIKSPVPINGRALAREFEKVAKTADFGDLTTTKAFQGIKNNLARITSSDNAWLYRSGSLDRTINKFAKGTTSLATQNQFLGGQARNIINKALGEAHENITGLFSKYNKASAIENLLVAADKISQRALDSGIQTAAVRNTAVRAAARKASDVAARAIGAGTAPGGPGIIGGVRAGLGRSAQALAAPSRGIGLEQALTMARTQPGALAGALRGAAGPAVARVGLGVPIAREATGFNKPPAPPSPEELTAELEGLRNQFVTAQEVQQLGAQQAAQASPYPRENLLADIQQDPENANKYLEFYKTINEAFGAGQGEELNVTKLTSEDYTNAVNGLNALEQYAQELQRNPAALSVGKRIPGQDITAFGIGSDISRLAGTSTLNSLGFQMIENLLRIQTGAAAPESEVRRYMKTYLPQPGDDQATQARKLQSLESAYQNILSIAQNKSLTSPTQDALTAALGGQ